MTSKPVRLVTKCDKCQLTQSVNFFYRWRAIKVCKNCILDQQSQRIPLPGVRQTDLTRWIAEIDELHLKKRRPSSSRSFFLVFKDLIQVTALLQDSLEICQDVYDYSEDLQTGIRSRDRQIETLQRKIIELQTYHKKS